MAARSGHQQRPRTDKAFFIGKRQSCALLKGCQPRRQPGKADNRRHDPVCRSARRIHEGLGTGCGFDPRARQERAQFRQGFFKSGYGKARVQTARLLCKPLHIAPTGQGNHLIGARIAGNQIDGILTD